MDNTRRVLFLYQIYQARLREILMNPKALSTNLTCVLEALHGKLDIKRPGIFYLSVTSHINGLAAH